MDEKPEITLGTVTYDGSQGFDPAGAAREAKLSFYRHLIVSVGVGMLAAGINLMTSPGLHWFWWVLAVLAISLAGHWVKAFVLRPKNARPEPDKQAGR